MHPGELSASEASSLRFALDSELAFIFRQELRRVREAEVKLIDAIKYDSDFRNVLAEFNRRRLAHANARASYSRALRRAQAMADRKVSA